MTVNIITGGVLTGTAIYYNLQVEPIFVGSVLGTIVTPDYDLMKNLPKSIISKIPIIGFIWFYFWWPYAKLIKHRSFLSHSIFVSTILRFIYLFALPLLLLRYDTTFEVLAFMLLAWSIQDATHILLDTF